MKSWKSERDKLIEETLAFAHSVASGAPKFAASLLHAKSAPSVEVDGLTHTATANHARDAVSDLAHPDHNDELSHAVIVRAAQTEPDPITPSGEQANSSPTADLLSDIARPSGSPTAVDPRSTSRNETVGAESQSLGDETNRSGRPAALGLKPVKTTSLTPRSVLPALSERSAINCRVAAFRAHQIQQLEEREAYIRLIQEKIRGALGTRDG